MILGMDLNDDPYTQTDIAQAKQEGWCDAADLQAAQDGKPRGPTYSENSTWEEGAALTTIDVILLNSKAAALFLEHRQLSTQDVKKHRPQMVVLDMSSLEQEISVAEAPTQFPVDTMLPMAEEEEERLGERCLNDVRAALEEAHSESPPNTVRIQQLLDGVAEEYLMKRTVGAKGKPGRKGRGTAPRIKKEPLFQEAKADALGEEERLDDHEAHGGGAMGAIFGRLRLGA